MFQIQSKNAQAPVAFQLIVTLVRLGHIGNGGAVGQVQRQFRIGAAHDGYPGPMQNDVVKFPKSCQSKDSQYASVPFMAPPSNLTKSREKIEAVLGLQEAKLRGSAASLRL
ncbi:hypothetical protein PsorP6_013372 [Peronosclerospora sorghi]|uniref:Uncharacterized protein n=1 Tax=Peronosclerospora sorghi TaxID=230839 RepID=A0ACC0WI44_9STRA|nr:hypothetical protein PsorP6_013372 [Peronosclerospora sorghi]